MTQKMDANFALVNSMHHTIEENKEETNIFYFGD